MRQLLHFWGIKRSGNHAIIPWILGNATALNIRTTFFNSVLRHSEYFSEMPQVTSSDKNHISIISYEDCDLSHAMLMLTVVQEQIVMPDSNYRHLILLRDPFNTFASRMKRIENQVAVEKKTSVAFISWTKTVDLWKQYAREFLRETNLLKGEKIPINYNSWVADRNYRDNLLAILGYQNVDINKERVAKAAGGSSFDLLTKDGRASEMAVFDRWQFYKDNPLFRSLFEDAELLELSNRIFGHIEGTEIILQNQVGK